MIRSPVSLQRLNYISQTQQVLYQSNKGHAQEDSEIIDPMEFVARHHPAQDDPQNLRSSGKARYRDTRATKAVATKIPLASLSMKGQSSRAHPLGGICLQSQQFASAHLPNPPYRRLRALWLQFSFSMTGRTRCRLCERQVSQGSGGNWNFLFIIYRAINCPPRKSLSAPRKCLNRVVE